MKPLYILPSGDAVDPSTITSVRLNTITNLHVLIKFEGAVISLEYKTPRGAKTVRNRIIRELAELASRDVLDTMSRNPT